MLDAARTCVEAFGIRRTTLTDVARRAGVSRPTVYRRWPDVTALVADLLTREIRDILRRCEAGQDAMSGRELLVAQAAGVLTELISHPFFGRIIDHEPEIAATYAFHRLGSSHHAAQEAVRPLIEAGQRDGSIRPGDPDALARVVLLTVQGLASSRRLTEDVLTGTGLTAELRALLDGYLRPQPANP